MHVRPWKGALCAAAVAMLLGSAGCDQVQQQLTGAKEIGPVLRSLRETLNAKRTRLSSAVLNGQIDFVPGYINDLSATLDSLDATSAKMSMMDGQEMKIKIASARQAIKNAQPFLMQSDVEGLKAAQGNIDQVLFDIDGVLERAINMSASPSTATGGS